MFSLFICLCVCSMSQCGVIGRVCVCTVQCVSVSQATVGHMLMACVLCLNSWLRDGRLSELLRAPGSAGGRQLQRADDPSHHTHLHVDAKRPPHPCPPLPLGEWKGDFQGFTRLPSSTSFNLIQRWQRVMSTIYNWKVTPDNKVQSPLEQVRIHCKLPRILCNLLLICFNSLIIFSPAHVFLQVSTYLSHIYMATDVISSLSRVLTRRLTPLRPYLGTNFAMFIIWV